MAPGLLETSELKATYRLDKHNQDTKIEQPCGNAKADSLRFKQFRLILTFLTFNNILIITASL